MEGWFDEKSIVGKVLTNDKRAFYVLAYCMLGFAY